MDNFFTETLTASNFPRDFFFGDYLNHSSSRDVAYMFFFRHVRQ